MTRPDPNADDPIPKATNWKSVVTNSNTVTLRDLIVYAMG